MQAMVWLERMSNIIAMFSCALLALLTLIDIALRQLGVAFYWAGELSGFLLVWIIFLGLPTVSANRRHLRVDFLLVMTNREGSRWIAALSDLLTLVFVGALIFLIAQVAVSNLENQVRSQGLIGLPVHFPQWGLLAGLVLVWLRHMTFLRTILIRRAVDQAAITKQAK